MTKTLTTPELALGDIVLNGHNPRGAVNTSDEEFLELKGSIEREGIHQPILVSPAGEDGKHVLIAGERRFTAAKELKLKTIPVHVRDLKGEEALAAIVENVQRQNLSPVQEAEALARLREDFGLTQVEAAKKLGKSERWARDRERLVDLPEKTKQAFDDRRIPLEAAPGLQKVAEKAPQVAEAIAELDLDNEAGTLNLARPDHLIEAIEEAIDKEDVETGCMVAPAHIEASTLEGIGLSEKVEADFKARLAQIDKVDPYYFSGALSLNEKAIDDARAYGCLLELETITRWGEKRIQRYITDPAWLVDRFDELLADRLKEAEKKRKEENKARGKEPASKDDNAKADTPEAKEERRQEREEELNERAAKRAVNLELGAISAKALRAPKLTLEEAKAFALLAVGREAWEIGLAGIGLCDTAFQKETKTRSGVKVAYESGTGNSAGPAIVKAIEEAKTPEEALGVALRAMLLAIASDKEVVPPSQRQPWRIPGSHGGPTAVPDLLKRAAADRGLNIGEIRKGLDDRARQTELEGEIPFLELFAKSRAKAGVSAEVVEPADVERISELLSSKHLKEHRGDEGELSYTITPAGKKRLEKARGELKALKG